MAALHPVNIFWLIFAAELLPTEPDFLEQIDPNKIIFQVYSTNHSKTVKNPKLAKDAVEFINTTVPTVIIIHGWMTNSSNTWVQKMTNSLLEKHDHSNVITVDWSSYATSINYPKVKLQARQVGNLVGNFIVNITRNNTEDLSNVHIIGHSLGAQAAGYAGQKVYWTLREKISRITGLDAAGPLFESLPPSARLSKDDAHRVDAIHTNGGIFGFRESYGTTDFFPNGGTHQPGCENDLCSHSYSQNLYIESIFSDGLIAVKCASYLRYLMGLCNTCNKTVMGYNQPSTASGNYYLTTNTKPPYAMGNWCV